MSCKSAAYESVHPHDPDRNYKASAFILLSLDSQRSPCSATPRTRGKWGVSKMNTMIMTIMHININIAINLKSAWRRLIKSIMLSDLTANELTISSQLHKNKDALGEEVGEDNRGVGGGGAETVFNCKQSAVG